MAEVKPKVSIIDPDQETPREVLAAAIVDLARASKHLLSSGIVREDLVVLIQRRATAAPRESIRAVLSAIDQIAEEYAPRIIPKKKR